MTKRREVGQRSAEIERSREEAAEYWGRTDASRLFEEGEDVTLEVDRPPDVCRSCGGQRLTRHRLDLPILAGRLIVPGIDALHCPECKSAFLEPASEQFVRRILTKFVSPRKITQELRVASAFISDFMAGKATSRRRIVTIYFPSRARGPRAAKMSIRPSDPLAPILRRMGSEEIRGVLGLKYFEDLEKAAGMAHRTVSQYLHVMLTKKLLRSEDRASRPSP